MVSLGVQLFAVVSAAATVLSGVAFGDIFHVTVDNVLTEVCVNGVAEPQSSIPNYDTVRFFDHIDLPADWKSAADGCISVLGHNTNPLTASGVLGCVTFGASNPTALQWKCAPRYAVGGDCCGSCARSIWSTPGVSNLRVYKPNQKHPRDFVDKLHDECPKETRWIWDKHRKQPNVCCTLRACGNLCKSCKVAGAGDCDPGKCMFGRTDIALPPPNRVCNYKCCLEMKTPSDPNLTPSYRIINSANGFVRETTCTTRYCMFVLDIEKCDTVETANCANVFECIEKINNLNIVPENANLANVRLSSWDGVVTYAPWITVGTLVGGVGGPIDDTIHDKVTSASLCLAGYQGAVLTVSDISETPFP